MNDFGVIFDMDGVLVLTENAHWESWLVAARPRGTELSYQKFKSCFGRVNPDCVPILFGPGVSTIESNAIADEKEAAFREIVRANVPLAPGIKQLLTELKRLGGRLAVGSSGPRENVELIVNAGGLAPFFDGLVDGSQVCHGKPAPDCFLLAAKKIGIPPAVCAVIEDAPPGIQAAVAAGMRAIGVSTTHPAAELIAAGAHGVYADPSQISPRELMESLRPAAGK